MRGFAVVIAGACMLAGCGGTPPAQSGPTGTVHGVVMQVGGPAGTEPLKPAGTVVLSRDGHEVRHEDVAAGQQYSFDVAAGSYVLTVKGVEGACGSQDVTVVAHADTQKDLTCSIK
jgi:hypothetical protein